MKQLVILSGKGGTGKTSVAAAFAHLAAEGKPAVRVVLADADVDAANLELVLQPHVLEKQDFSGGAAAVIDPEKCENCGICAQVCRFDAILAPPDASLSDHHEVDPIACEGCAACVYQCPEAAIHMEPQLAGYWFRSDSRYGPLYHAALRPAQENSGKLVTMVKQQARLRALDDGYDAILVDGPPGIGCPVISAVSGADIALIVAEPTAAGIHDMARVLDTVAHFRVPALVCINKADVYPAGTAQIETYCQEHDVAMLGRIPFDTQVTQAMVQGQPVTVFDPESPASEALRAMWQRLVVRLSEQLT